MDLLTYKHGGHNNNLRNNKPVIMVNDLRNHAVRVLPVLA
jgi:hypothetical protein